jgi:hypothetical protein
MGMGGSSTMARSISSTSAGCGLEGVRPARAAAARPAGQQLLDPRQAGQRAAQRAHVAGVAGAGVQAGDQPFQVADLHQRIAQVEQQAAALHEASTASCRRAMLGAVGQRAHQPVAQQARCPWKCGWRPARPAR